MPEGVLYVVATPIGNLDDISLRAIETLKNVDLVAVEDTRHSRKLLDRFGIGARLVSLHEHNEARQSPGLVEKLCRGASIALVSDAGTPLLSDPGFRLVRSCVEAGVTVSPVPGASAVTAALSASGLPTDRFVFEGFLPSKPTARRARMAELKSEARTLVLFESSHRILAAIEDLGEIFGPERPAALCRELTKQFETILRGTLAELRQRLCGDRAQQKGEFVIVLAGHEARDDQILESGLELARALLEYLPPTQAARVAARLTGAPRRAIYDQIGKQTG